VTDDLVNHGIFVERIVADEESASGVSIRDVPLDEVFKSPEVLQLEARIRELEETNLTLLDKYARVVSENIDLQLKLDAAEQRGLARAAEVAEDTDVSYIGNYAAQEKIRAAILALSPAPDMVLVPREPTEAMWGNNLVRALIFWQRDEKATPKNLFAHCKNCGVDVPLWLLDEPEMKSTDHVTSKSTVAVLIYRAMIGAKE
jgi:hypothetical protein